MRSASRRVVVAVLGATLMLGACGGGGAPKPALMRGVVNAQPNVNPDRQGRPSPVVVRLYMLNSLAAFEAADYFALDLKDKETLAAELIEREEFRMKPGERVTVERKLKPEVRYVAVTAAFRDLERAQWRSSVEVPWPKKGKLMGEIAKAPKEMLKSERKWDLEVKLQGIKVELAATPMQ